MPVSRVEKLAPAAEHLTLLVGIAGSGKRTLVRTYQPRLRFFDASRVTDRERLLEMPSAAWAARVGAAAIDNLDTAPQLQARILRLFEQRVLPPTLLLMSARPTVEDPLLRLDPAALQQLTLWPLTAAELAADEKLLPPLLDWLLVEEGSVDDLLAAEPGTSGRLEQDLAEAAIDHLLRWGGLPALVQLDPVDRASWLAAYEDDFPARNAGPTGRLKPLPFRRFRRACAVRAGTPLSQTQLTRDSHVNVRTGRRYLEHLERLFQLFLLEAFPEPLTGAPVKSPQLHMLDLGLWQQLLNAPPERDQLVKSLLVTEVVKWIATADLPVAVRTYRTHTGLNIDLMLENNGGLLALHMVPRERLLASDCRPLTEVGRALGARWRGGILAYQGRTLEHVAPGIWAVPLARLLALPPAAAR